MRFLCRLLGERPSKVLSYSGCEAHLERTSHPPGASLGVQRVTVGFKRRQRDSRPETVVEGNEPHNNVDERADVVPETESNIQ